MNNISFANLSKHLIIILVLINIVIETLRHKGVFDYSHEESLLHSIFVNIAGFVFGFSGIVLIVVSIIAIIQFFFFRKSNRNLMSLFWIILSFSLGVLWSLYILQGFEK